MKRMEAVVEKQREVSRYRGHKEMTVNKKFQQMK